MVGVKIGSWKFEINSGMIISSLSEFHLHFHKRRAQEDSKQAFDEKDRFS